ncbi:DUF4231 domain-containing protein [Achromobacter sp. UMC71]|uniref:DUF4231 domain-containing protein n=1 Tax=Achromobacter sp. UMC71 TaxID=1862320 RepID=UPI0015FEDE7F
MNSFPPPDAYKLALDTCTGFKRKADHNKNESLLCFAIVVLCSLTSPLFVTLGDGLWIGKVLPSVLSLSAAASTAWLQLRKPQTLWSLYRDCQRRIEDHLYQYQYGLLDYALPENERVPLLVNAIRTIAWDAHQRWLPLVPTPEAIDTKTITSKNEHNSPN